MLLQVRFLFGQINSWQAFALLSCDVCNGSAVAVGTLQGAS